MMLKKYSIIGFLLLCSCGSDGGGDYYGNYDEGNYWNRNGRYGRSHRHDGHHGEHGHHGGGHQGGGHHGGGHHGGGGKH